MSFSLWIAGDVAWAQGMYESRPMGTAVISVTDLFKRRDFRPERRAPGGSDASYVGLCASFRQVPPHFWEAPSLKKSAPSDKYRRQPR
jgi:hypothetical protein